MVTRDWDPVCINYSINALFVLNGLKHLLQLFKQHPSELEPLQYVDIRVRSYPNSCYNSLTERYWQ